MTPSLKLLVVFFSDNKFWFYLHQPKFSVNGLPQRRVDKKIQKGSVLNGKKSQRASRAALGRALPAGWGDPRPCLQWGHTWSAGASAGGSPCKAERHSPPLEIHEPGRTQPWGTCWGCTCFEQGSWPCLPSPALLQLLLHHLDQTDLLKLLIHVTENCHLNLTWSATTIYSQRASKPQCLSNLTFHTTFN